MPTLRELEDRLKPLRARDEVDEEFRKLNKKRTELKRELHERSHPHYTRFKKGFRAGIRDTFNVGPTTSESKRLKVVEKKDRLRQRQIRRNSDVSNKVDRFLLGV